jgi:Rho-binding antiterminator
MYDYIEIVCLFKYPVEIHLKSGEIVKAIGQDTKLNDARQECIVVNTLNSEKKQGSVLIVLECIVQLSILQDNPHFKTISFR